MGPLTRASPLSCRDVHGSEKFSALRALHKVSEPVELRSLVSFRIGSRLCSQDPGPRPYSSEVASPMTLLLSEPLLQSLPDFVVFQHFARVDLPQPLFDCTSKPL